MHSLSLSLSLSANWLCLWYIQLKHQRTAFQHVHGNESKKPLPIRSSILSLPATQSTPAHNDSFVPSIELSDKNELKDLYEDIATNGGYQPVIDTTTTITTTTPADSFLHRRDIASTPLSTSSRCLARTRTGLPCRLQAQANSAFCHRHNGF